MNPFAQAQMLAAIFNDYEGRINRWEGVLISTELPSDLITPVAEILAQDELQGTSARTAHQRLVMARAAQATSQLQR
jgi:hypothetical protein